MAEDPKCKVTPQITKVAISIVSKLSALQNQLNKDGSKENLEHIKEIGSMMRYLLSHFSSNTSISMSLTSEQEIDYLILAAESEVGIGYYGSLPDGKSFNFRIVNDRRSSYRILTLYSFGKWVKNGMEIILKKAFKERKWVAERALQKDADIMHFIEEI